ncbi:ABC transporter ATP-binding protein [Litorilinea aerophila]|uniref:ATP-binding cassette domain-containing protein n=1 Tax=Litorilinea aerophila TaxID=1204385 RepID=A0A540VEJ0_9CHLR|nr:ATP-binding cassette domain-containing protein [Litorilinea aerophila]MCC9077136.1 ABC transporter ATP-binding protein [Litorilinea aerophila]
MIDVHGVSKAYGTIRALSDVSFTIEEGEIVGLLGPNGAGKTTLIKILTGYLQPDEGQVTIAGFDVLTQTQDVQAHIGYLPENAPLYPELSVQAYLKLMADLRRVPPAEQNERIARAVYATGLTDRLTQPIGQLSKGYRQRVGLAQAILHRPKLLILDEPTVGLDPTQIVEIRRLIRRLAQHATILFSTHILSEVEALCDRVLILMNGQVRADARISELATTHNAILVLNQEVAGVRDALARLDGVVAVERDSQNGYPFYRVRGREDADLCPAIYRLAADQGWPVRELRNDVQTLESVFNQLAVAA